jgi:hypothetical protein
MKQYFISNGLSIRVYRERSTNELTLGINSEFSGTEHKGTIRPNKEKLAEALEKLWKSIKTKKLQSIHVGFDEVDYYDDMTDVYETPTASIKRGLKKAKIGYNEHGSIPKDWEFNFSARFSDTSTSTPIMETVKQTIGSFFTPELEMKFKKQLTPVLQKKINSCSVENEWKEIHSSSYGYGSGFGSRIIYR